MAVYQRRTRVAAPLDEVWDFHSRVSGLEALTPDWLNLRVESVTGPDGDPDPEILEAGARIDASVRPFDIGPRQRWTSIITARERDDGTAYFRDRMEGGPFREWEHTHRFFADGDETIVDDRVAYALPLGPLDGAIAPLAKLGLDPMFRYRHRQTRERLESPERF
ncbi:Ligand-binding SRPBCC domain-containing protein [Haloplanus vescus]|uniref:Ligand-binding SRPBCC domain-containing protein n=1 Tax=Haloplanus vescus TaxID=555874 RepID=A0A1H4ALP9_9EURY|nr:SRPBCC family protein [Haloplanus vescus]SEA36614.1 Ligand-binding SRPBCC domain-containing protein [Haloplanus vescus]